MSARTRTAEWVEGTTMTATCSVVDPTGVDIDRDATMDPDTLQVTDAEAPEAYTGICSVRRLTARAKAAREGSQAVEEVDVVLGFPLGTDQLRRGMVATILTNTDDAGMVGRRFRLGKVHDSSYRSRVTVDACEVQT